MTGNTGNTGNAGSAGSTSNNATVGISGDNTGWFLPDRIDLPFVADLDANFNSISANRRTTITAFPDRSWSARWNAWRLLDEFVLTNYNQAWIDATKPKLAAALTIATVDEELSALVLAAQDERADALGEILAQDTEFFSYFMGLLTMAPGSHPKTYRVLHGASLIGSFAVLRFKNEFNRIRPSQLCPALLSPLPMPGHASFPSGHSTTQAHLMAQCAGEVLRQAFVINAAYEPDLALLQDDLMTLADRIARNREIAGLHYPSDSAAGVALAGALFPILTASTEFSAAIAAAAQEWIL